jgi:transposase
MIPYKQLSLADIFTDCQDKFNNDKYAFLELLDQTINLEDIVPVSFVSHFHASTGRPRKFLLFPMLRALLLQRIFSIPTDTLLLVFLHYSRELREFCGFDVVPDASKITRFKQDFHLDLQLMFGSSC